MRRLRLDRLRRMSLHEWRWRTNDAFETVAERARVSAGKARWKRSDIVRVLTGSTREACRDAVNRGDWQCAADTLAAHLAGRPARFVLDPSSSAVLRDEILTRWPDAARAAARRAGSI